MTFRKLFILATLVAIITGMGETFAKDDLPLGESELRIEAPRGPVPIYTYRPENFGPRSPIWIIMHGTGRNADDYFDVWRPFADKYGALLLVPEFGKEKWPSSWQYNFGNVTTSKLIHLPRRDWAFSVIQKAFAEAVRRTGSLETGFYFYGHSAGGQFVHRYVMQTGGAHVKLAISANSGWYILPDNEFRFPYGLRASPISSAALQKAFATPMVILLGQQDTERTRQLRMNRETEVQGPHRFARGHYFNKRSMAVAGRMGVPYRWRVIEVPGAGHRNDEMAPTAARVLAEAHR